MGQKDLINYEPYSFITLTPKGTAIGTIKDNACPSCEVNILDMNDPAVSSRANSLGIKSVPAIVIDGKLAGCCAGRGPDIEALKAAGLGVPIS